MYSEWFSLFGLPTSTDSGSLRSVAQLEVSGGKAQTATCRLPSHFKKHRNHPDSRVFLRFRCIGYVEWCLQNQIRVKFR